MGSFRLVAILFGGFNNRPEAKTVPGFSFKLYLRSDLLKTGFLNETGNGIYDYETFFKENPELGEQLAVEWDDPRYDVDHDPKTLHASRGGGKDDYWGQTVPRIQYDQWHKKAPAYPFVS